jgi:hypothetical protein
MTKINSRIDDDHHALSQESIHLVNIKYHRHEKNISPL